MTDPKWGKRYTCYKCGARFYDLNKSEAICPKCGADQAKAPAKSSARSKRSNLMPVTPDIEEPVMEEDLDDEEEVGLEEFEDDDSSDDEE